MQTRLDVSAFVNYRVRLPYYVVDSLFETAILIVGGQFGLGYRRSRA